MKIVVLSGSPKSEYSVTMQYVKYIGDKYPEHEFKAVNIASSIRKIENEAGVFENIIEEVRNSDGVIWAFPLYYLLVHSNYKRFIELIWERKAEEAFRGKYTAALSTSIHFYDHTAHQYIRAVCDDLEMKYTGFYSAEMNDLFKEEKRKQINLFARSFINAIENRTATSTAYKKLNYSMPVYKPGKPSSKVDLKGKKVVIVTDSTDINGNLGKMVTHLTESISGQPEIINLSDLNIKGGCLGCLHCGFDNKCVYDGSDDIRKVYEEKIQTADILIYAGSIRDRFLSSKWKLFMDRSFFNTHQPNITGKQVGYLVSGPLSGMENLREFIQAYVECEYANLVDIISDEYGDSGELDSLIENLASRLVSYSEEGYDGTDTFLGVAGTKLFRDEIFGNLRFVFQMDHRYYKKNGIYDFPQKNIRIRLMNVVMILMTKIPVMKKNIQKDMLKYMISPYKKLLEREK